jgi:hypothetical protein
MQAIVLIVGTRLSSARSGQVEAKFRLSSKYSESGDSDIEVFEQCSVLHSTSYGILFPGLIYAFLDGCHFIYRIIAG